MKLLLDNVNDANCILSDQCLLGFCRSANLAHINRLLREQLDQATAANQKLQLDLHRVLSINKDYEEKEIEWRKEEQVIYTFCVIIFTARLKSKYIQLQ